MPFIIPFMKFVRKSIIIAEETRQIDEEEEEKL